MSIECKRLSRKLIVISVLLVVFFIGGCSALLDPGPPPSFYMLTPELPGPQAGKNLTLQLAVMQPDADDMLASNRIATQLPNGEIQYWASAAWVSPAPAMIQRLLVEAYESMGRVTAMSVDSTGYLADYRMVSYLRQFTVVLSKDNMPAYVTVQITAHLLDLRSGKSVGYLNCKHSCDVSGNGLPAVIKAFDKATSDSLKEITAWSIDALQNPGG